MRIAGPSSISQMAPTLLSQSNHETEQMHQKLVPLNSALHQFVKCGVIWSAFRTISVFGAAERLNVVFCHLQELLKCENTPISRGVFLMVA